MEAVERKGEGGVFSLEIIEDSTSVICLKEAAFPEEADGFKVEALVLVVEAVSSEW